MYSPKIGNWIYSVSHDDFFKIANFSGDHLWVSASRESKIKIANWQEKIRCGEIFPATQEEVENVAIAKAQKDNLREKPKDIEGSPLPPEFLEAIAAIEAKNQKKKKQANKAKATPTNQLPQPEKTQEEIDRANIEFIKKHWSAERYQLHETTISGKKRGRKKKPQIGSSAQGSPTVDRIELAKTIDYLHIYNLPPLPVAPAFPASEYPRRGKNGKILRDKKGHPLPKFTGKNPSYIGPNGKPHIISYKKFNRPGIMPSNQELNKWFADIRTGIGTLARDVHPFAAVQLNRGGVQFIDLDAKHFEDEEEIEETVAKIRERYGNGFIEKTRSGGYRFGFISFQLHSKHFSIDDKFVGEILGPNEQGIASFIVLAPTPGYENLQRESLPELTPTDLGLGERCHLSQKERCQRRTNSKSKRDRFCRFPAQLWPVYKQPIKLWLFARHLDPTGKGWGRFTIEAAATFWKRRPSTIRLWLKKCRKMGLCRGIKFENGYCHFYYASIHNATANAGLKKLGACGLIDFDVDEERQNLGILASELIHSERQKNARFASQKETETRVPKPRAYFQTCEQYMAWVLWRSSGHIGISENGISYGANLDGTAIAAGLSKRQIQRHLSAKYRRESSPIKKYRGEGLTAVNKAQIHQRLRYGTDGECLMALAEGEGEGDRYWTDSDGRVWERKTLIVVPRHQLIRWRFRRSRVSKSAETSNFRDLTG